MLSGCDTSNEEQPHGLKQIKSLKSAEKTPGLQVGRKQTGASNTNTARKTSLNQQEPRTGLQAGSMTNPSKSSSVATKLPTNQGGFTSKVQQASLKEGHQRMGNHTRQNAATTNEVSGLALKNGVITPSKMLDE